jgi:DNA-binding NarL/FixJ family response regulator
MKVLTNMGAASFGPFRNVLERRTGELDVVSAVTVGGLMAGAGGRHDLDLVVVDGAALGPAPHDILRHLVELARRVPVVFVSAADGADAIIAAIENGARAYIQAPGALPLLPHILPLVLLGGYYIPAAVGPARVAALLTGGAAVAARTREGPGGPSARRADGSRAASATTVRSGFVTRRA